MKNISYKNKRLLVVGAGRAGIAVANLLSHYGADVSICDIKKRQKLTPLIRKLNPSVETHFGNQSSFLLAGIDIVVKSPGVPPEVPILQKACARGIRITSEIEIAYDLSPNVPIVGITGTNGKTTTTELVGRILKKNGKNNVIVAGNIGLPFSNIIRRIRKNTIVVLEISSYQLENIERFRPRLSAILNITPDHLERYDKMNDYIDAKAQIFSNQSRNDYLILNYDDIRCRSLAKRAKAITFFFSIKKRIRRGVFVQKRSIFYSLDGRKIKPLHIRIEDIRISGSHNLENALVGILIGKIFGLSDERIRDAVRSFKGLPHRLEVVQRLEGRIFVNDSKATNVSSVHRSLETFFSPIILIMGGRDKGSPYMPLRKIIKNKVKRLIVIGEAASKIDRELKGYTSILKAKTIRKAVSTAYRLGCDGDVILLSPGCSSFDQYSNFEERGEDFKKWVRNLKLQG